MMTCLSNWCLAVVLWIGPPQALVVDPAHTDTGQAIAEAIGRDEVWKGDITDLRRTKVGAERVIWLSPEPTLYSPEVLERFQKIVGDPSIDLILIGLPHDQAGCDKLVELLRGRGSFSIGKRLNPHLAGAQWIWSRDGAKENQTIQLRKTFDVSKRPARAWLEITGDNRVTTTLNGAVLGTADSWRHPVAYDVTDRLREGENVLELEAWNEDGPAGVVASLLGTDARGETLFRIVTDKTWPDAKVIAKFGEGPWEGSIFENVSADTFDVAGGERAVVLRHLIAGDKYHSVLKAGEMTVGVRSGRPGLGTSIFALEPDKRKLGPALLEAMGFSIPKAEPTTRPNGVNRTIDRESYFPVTIQYSPIPYEGVAYSSRLPDTPSARRRLIDNLIAHGCTVLQCPLPVPDDEARGIEEFAQSRGMGITYVFEHGLEGFGREQPPPLDVYSDAYKQDLFKRLDKRLPVLDRYKNLVEIFPMQDEPFRAGVKALDLSEAHQKSVQKYYEYHLPVSNPPSPRDPGWRDFVDANSHDYPVAWQVMYNELKRRLPNVKVAINHDSHNIFGGAVGQEGKLFLDDVFTWSPVYADTFSFDIYPYLMKDFRYGPNRTLMVPRMAQMHFAMAQMRTLTPPLGSDGKTLGFYFGTYHPEWFDLTAKGKEEYWMSREMAYTAVAGGANELIAGLNVPIDARHWEDLGDALNVLQKASLAILKTAPPRASAAMWFPRYQCLVAQEEYWNVAQSFEMLQRAHGELDILPEFSTLARLDAYTSKLLALFDVRLLEYMHQSDIEGWVQSKGGVVLADCVPRTVAAEGAPERAMNELFGVRDADTRRILWPVKMKAEVETDSPLPATMPASTQPTDAVRGEAFGQQFDFPIVSPRPCTVTDGEVLLKTAAGNPALVRKKTGKGNGGRAYLLGFCLQDTTFEAWRRNDRKTIDQLTALLRAVAADANVKPAIRSSNGDIEAGLRTSADDTFVIVVAHEPIDPATRITVRHLKPPTRSVQDVATGQEVPFKNISGDGDAIEFDLSMPMGSTKLLRILR